MRACGKYFSGEAIDRIRRAVEKDPSLSRGRLSQEVCRWLDWRSPNGKLKEVSCRKALLKLERNGLITLPESAPSHNLTPRISLMDITDMAKIRCDFSGLGKVTLEPVSGDRRNREKSRVWNAIMERFHYLGSGPLCGAQIRYLIQSDRHGLLGGISHSAGTLRLKDRDRWIGWGEAARRANLGRVVCNSRFLILPSVRVKNLASHVLALSARRLGGDWEERYGYRPALLETFVDPQRFDGACYKAANWIHIGQTAGRSGFYANGKKCGSGKDIYVYPLERNFREVLRREPNIRLFSQAREKTYSNWREEEFAAAQVYDPRLRKRLDILAADLCQNPGESITGACGGSAPKTKAARRFLSHPEINMERLLRGHAEATAVRMRKRRMVLTAEESIEFPLPGGAGSENAQNHRQALPLRLSMAFACDGTPLGALGLSTDETDHGGESDSFEAWIWEKCPKTAMTSLGDFGPGSRALFDQAGRDKTRVLLSVGPGLRRAAFGKKAWRKMSFSPVSGHCEANIPCRRRGEKPGEEKTPPMRKARLAVRHASAVRKTPGGGEIRLWAVWAREVGKPGPDPVDWAFVTHMPVRHFHDARLVLERGMARLTARRWAEAFQALAPGDDREVRDAESFKNLLALLMVMAWRRLRVKALGGGVPGISRWALSRPHTSVFLSCFERQPGPEKAPGFFRTGIMPRAATSDQKTFSRAGPLFYV
ncbi:conserved hypothetical protein [Candidatus Desulfarcum epimagneticum]|uniref:Transposase Tn5-like N-terminal domain-containing protein n=1 Tax=uncultured Desulfobacteraceae bacterium TaxID=218296 RepID=A0A484HDE1_9BACT|nr:conserved hypothetical protein [uncultured Desulfobacteraceae bacterium]